MPNQTYNPIVGVRPSGSSASYTVVPVPSKYDWKLSDVSSADAGRTEDTLMHKLRIAQKVHLELEWQNLNDGDAQLILTAFDAEYLQVKYFDYKYGTTQTRTFYVGDREVVSHSRIRHIATIAFNLIEQ